MGKEILTEFKQKILSTKFSEGTISEKGGNIEIKTSYAVGNINFYELEVTIVEMSVTNLADDENKFYLHFELREIAYAEELFSQMLETITDLKNQQKLKILLSCTGGLTTGFFADKLNEAAELLSLEYEFDAVPFHKIYNVGFDYSVILLAPQIAYQLKNAQEILHDKLVLKIPPKVFASYDSGEMLQFINSELDNWTKTVEERAIAKVRAGLIKSDAKILSIAVMPFASQTRIAYRIYQKGVPLLNEVVIKGRLDPYRDIRDILDTVSHRCVPFDAVGIAISGIVHNGRLNLNYFGALELDLQKIFENGYKVPVTVTNNVNSAVLGYYAQQEKFNNILFLSRPKNFMASGLGIVINGRMIQGAHGITGEIKFLTKSLVGGKVFNEANLVDWSTIYDEISTELRAGIAVIDPELVCIRSEMTPDLDKLKEKIHEYLPSEYMPEFVCMKDEEMAEYVLLGQMILSLESLEERGN
ncbi:MAG: ROK family protein [Selenomonadaceae bacterium]|nr:ROK family protein [Selenomonadaceae bacterium]